MRVVDHPWAVRLTADAVADKYKVSRGEAAQLSDALATLYNGPTPSGYKPYGEGAFANLFEFTCNGYRIIYEVLAGQRAIRVIYFEPTP